MTDESRPVMDESVNEAIWWQVIQPAYPSTGGLAQTMYCLVCGSAIIITKDDARPASLHIGWHASLDQTGGQ